MMEDDLRSIGRLGCILLVAVTFAGAARVEAQTTDTEVDAAPVDPDAGTPTPGPSVEPAPGPVDDEPGTTGADAGPPRGVGTDEATSEAGSSGAPMEDDAPQAADTGIRGRVVDARTGEGVRDAVVVARGRREVESAVTNETGGYALPVPQGRYSVLSYGDLYHGARMPRVVVRSARWTDLTLTLEPMDAEAVVEEVEIVYRADTTSAAAQDQLRAAASGIGEGVGAAQMSRSGASDAGGAARNVVGVTLEGTSLNIRGLGGRYTLVLLNGVPLPSVDPDVPSVDLDLFPTAVIDNLQVSKAFLPNLPASFAGGVLDIRTVRFPTEPTFQLGVGVGANTLTTFRNRLGYAGGDLDWLGVDDGTRRFPSGLEDAPLVLTRTGPYTSRAQLEQAAERFPNRWQFDRSTAAPSFGLEATLGDSVDLGSGRRFGYLVTAFYDYDAVREVGISRYRPTLTEDGGLAVNNDLTVERGRDEVRLGALGTASLELGPDDAVTFLTMYNRSATDEVELNHGINAELDTGAPTTRWQLQFLARSMWFNQLQGDHRNVWGSRARLRWTAYGAYGAREEPDRRTVTYGSNGAAVRWLEKSGSGERFYSNLEQGDGGGNLDLRFPLWSEAWGTLGGHGRFTARDFGIRRVRMLQHPDNMDQSVYTRPVEELFDAEGIGTLTRLNEFPRETDSYHAESQYYAAYAMLETPLGDRLSFSGGARLEVFQQLVQSQSPFSDQRPEEPAEGSLAERSDLDVLPAGTLRLELAEGMFLRAGYGMTVARPQTREIAPYQYYDFVRDRNIMGNPDLSRTLIQNADLRWEWYFGEGEILALSAFYKYFDRPIELQIFNANNYDSQYINANFAHNVGGELELRLSLRHLHESLRFFSVNSNFALIWSTVQLPDALSGAVQSERPLTGQAPYVANASLQFDHPDAGITAAVVYNVVGPRVTDVGTRVNDDILPNIERAPFHQLDVVVSWRFEEHYRLQLKLRNLLFQAQDWYQGDFLERRLDPGTSGSLSFQYSH